MTLGVIALGPLQLDAPAWLWLLLPLVLLTVWIGRSSLSALGTWGRRFSLAVRLLVISVLVLTLARPHWRWESKDVAVTIVLDESDSVPPTLQRRGAEILQSALPQGRQGGDRLGVITTAREAYVQQLPSRGNQGLESQHPGALDATNLADPVRLAMAVRPPDAAGRVVLMSDGNQTTGSVLEQAMAAKAAGVPIDVLPVTYRNQSEVLLDRVVGPATARMGERVVLRVVLQSTKQAIGRLSVTQDGELIDLDPDSPASGAIVELQPGLNAIPVSVTALRAGPMRFEASFEPLAGPGGVATDTILANNRASAVTFVSAQGRVLVVGGNHAELDPLLRVLQESKLDAETITGEQFPADLTQMNAYDAVIMVNQPAYALGQRQQDDLARYVRESGGGLLMIGGPESFGAGGWIGSPVEDVLPIRLDPPSKRQMPKGALVLVIHSVEMPSGVFYGKKVCEAAVGALSKLDEAGIVEYSGGSVDWVHPLTPVGSGEAVRRSISGLNFGDMPDFAPSLELALVGLQKSQAGQKHCIIISDGDPSPPSDALLQKFVQSKVSITAVGMACHGPSDQSTMRRMARLTGGRFYDIPADKVETLPQIFIKEAQTVRRTLIWEGQPFAPKFTGLGSEMFKGLPTSVPPISGYIVAADREGLSQVTLRGKEDDPILAQWQHGLGRSVTFTSDAAARWSKSWVAWPDFRAFWERHVRWVMRPSGSPNVRVSTDTRGDETIIVVDALDAQGQRLTFATFRGRLAGPDGQGQDVDLAEVGPGRYEGRVRTERSGTYVLGLRYAAPQGDGKAPLEGSVQASITRPFADEYRAMQDNAALLEQVRAMTGGRRLPADPAQIDLWSRQGLVMPFALRSVWMLAAMAALALFLFDVLLRRVRIEPAAIAGATRRLFSRSAGAQATRVDTLLTARRQVRQTLDRPPPPPAEEASRKFEADLSRPPAAPGDVVGGSAPGSAPPAPRSQAQDVQEGISSLLRAKERARREMDDRA